MGNTEFPAVRACIGGGVGVGEGRGCIVAMIVSVRVDRPDSGCDLQIHDLCILATTCLLICGKMWLICRTLDLP